MGVMGYLKVIYIGDFSLELESVNQVTKTTH